MKIVYYTSPSFFDFETSLIRELSKYAEVYVIFNLASVSMKSAGFEIDDLDERCAIIPAIEYKGFDKYSSLINLENWVIANKPREGFINEIRLANSTLSYIKKIKPDVIHFTSFCKSLLFLIPLLNKCSKQIFTVHDPILHIDERNYSEKIKRKVIFSLVKNVILLNTKLDEDFLFEYKSYKLRIFHSKLGVYDYLSLYPPKKIIENKYILFFGRVAKYKGIEVLINAFLNSNAKRNGVKLVIAGKGILDFDLSLYNHDDSIIFINRFIKTQEITSLISNSLFVVCPYIEATQSGVIMSSFALKKPVIATNVGGLSETITNLKTGLLVEPNNIDELTKAIDKLNSDHILLEYLSDSISTSFLGTGERSWDQISKDLINIYNSI